MKTVEIKLDDETFAKLQGACSEVAGLNPMLKFEPKSLISLLVELAEYDELVEKILLFEDKRLRQQIREIATLRKGKKKEPVA